MVDPCDYGFHADPKILTGSHNWSSSANTVNDENTVIVHDSSIANQYYQAFHADFLAVTTAAKNPVNLVQTCIPLGVNELHNIDQVTMFPNPTSNSLKVELNMPGTDVVYGVYNSIGQLVQSGKLDARYVNTINTEGFASGMYLLRVQTGTTKEFVGKFIKQ